MQINRDNRYVGQMPTDPRTASRSVIAGTLVVFARNGWPEFVEGEQSEWLTAADQIIEMLSLSGYEIVRKTR